MKEFKNSKWLPEWLEKEYIENNKTKSAMAEQLEVSTSTVRKWLISNEIIDVPKTTTSVCKICGKEFVHYKSQDRQFCSHECYSMSMKKYALT